MITQDELKPRHIADALEKCDWAGASIGNKAIVSLAVEALRNTRPAPADLRAADRKHYKLIRKSLQNKGLLPAATDTGLEPWGYGWFELGGKKMASGYLPTVNYPRSENVTEGPFPLYTRSQADELLAAERAEMDNFKRQAREHFDAFCAMRNDINELIGDMPSLEGVMLEAGPEDAPQYQAVVEAVKRALAEKEELEAECRVLAKRCIEKDALIKDLEADVKREAQSSTHNAQDCLDEQMRAEALEAKLAAAEKALDAIASYSDRPNKEFREEHPEFADIMRIAIYRPDTLIKRIGEFARAVLGGKP